MKLFKRKEGQGTTEYVLIVAAIAIVSFIVIQNFLLPRLQNAADAAGAQVETYAGGTQ